MSRFFFRITLLILSGCGESQQLETCWAQLGEEEFKASKAKREAEADLVAKDEEIATLTGQVDRLKLGDDPYLRLQQSCQRQVTTSGHSVIYDRCLLAASMDVEVDCAREGDILSHCRISRPSARRSVPCDREAQVKLLPPGGRGASLTTHCPQGGWVGVRLETGPEVGPRVLVGSEQGFQLGGNTDVDARSGCDLSGVGASVCKAIDLDVIRSNSAVVVVPSQPEQIFYFNTVRSMGH